LRIQFDPKCIELGLNINGKGELVELERVHLTTQLSPQAMPEYARLLQDVFQGDATLSIRGDEAEGC
jgi:glucose-6-phosphate 1-dehydrogenase